MHSLVEHAEAALTALAGVCLLLMMLLISSDAILRYLSDAPIEGVFEVSENYLMPTIVFGTLSYAYARGAIISVHVFVRQLSPLVRRQLTRCYGIVGGIMVVAVLIGGWALLERAIEIGSVAGGVEIPLWPGYALLCIGSIVFLARLLLTIIDPQPDCDS